MAARRVGGFAGRRYARKTNGAPGRHVEARWHSAHGRRIGGERSPRLGQSYRARHGDTDGVSAVAGGRFRRRTISASRNWRGAGSADHGGSPEIEGAVALLVYGA